MFRRFLASRRASTATYSEGSFSHEPTPENFGIKKEESEKERLVFQTNDEDDTESVVDEELSFIVDYLGSDHIAEVQSVPLLMETLKRVKKQHTRTIRVDFVIRDGILKVSNVQQGALLITAPLYAVALCAQEQLRGFDSTFAINITRKRLHMCHVFQAGSRLEASSIVKSVAVSFKSVGRLLKDRRERARTIESTSLHSAERFRADSTGSQGRERMRTDSEGSRDKTRVDGDHYNNRKRHQSVSGGRGGKTHLPTLPSEESLETNGSGTGSTGHRPSVVYAQVHSSASRDTASGRQPARNNENDISSATDLQDVVNMFSRESISDLEHSVPPSDEELPRKDWSDLEERGDLVCFHEAVDAISRGNKTALECLLNEGLSVNAENKSHLSLMHYAVLSEKLEIVGLLLERGADPNCEGPRDQTPLHCAAARGNRGITKLLLSHGANVRAKDRQFRTPLHLCAGNLQNLEVSYVLVEHGARIEENDLEGTRPIDLHLELREMQNRLVQSVCEAFAVSDLARSRSDSGSSSVHSSNARISRDVSSSRDYSPSSSANKAIVNSKALGRVRSASVNRSDETSMRAHRRTQKGRKITENHEVTYQADAAETLRNVISDVEEKIASEAQMATSIELHRSRSDSIRSGSGPHFRQSSHVDLPKSMDMDRVPQPYSSHRFKGTADTREKTEEFTDSDCSVESGTLIPGGLQGPYTDARLSKPMDKSTRESEDFRSSHRRMSDDPCSTRELNGFIDERRSKPDQWSDNVLSSRYAIGPQNLQRSNTVGSKSAMPYRKKAIDPWESTDLGQLSRRAVEEVTSSEDEDVERRVVTEIRRGMSLKEERSGSGSYSKLFSKKDPTQDALSLLVTLSANPECHSSILESLCLPKPSSRLITIASSSNDVEQRQQISTLMGNLFSPSRPDTKSRAVQAGLLKTVIDLLEAPDPIQGTCLSILRDLLQSENDKDYTAAVTSVPIEPLLSLVEKSQNKEATVSSSTSSNLRLASKVCQSSLDSIPPQRGRQERVTSPEAKRSLSGKKCKTAYCQDDISIDNHPKQAVFSLRDTRKANSVDTRHGSVSGVLQGSCADYLEGTPVERSSLLDGKENVYSDATRRGERSGDAFWEMRGDSFSIHNKMKRPTRFFSGFDLIGNNCSSTFHAKHIAMKMLGAASTNPKIQVELSKKRALQLLLQSAGSFDPEMASLAVCALANVALNFDTHQQLEEEKIQDDIIPLLEHKDVRVRYHAARGLIYLGNFDVEDVYLYHLVDGLPDTQTALFSEDASGQIRYVRGTTLEHLVLCLTTDVNVLWDGSSLPPPSPSEKKASGRNAGTKINGKYFPSEQQIISFVLTMYQTFTHPLIFMRLLLHRFHDPVHFRVFEELDDDVHGVFFDRFGPLPSVHARLMRIWITWLENFPEDFSKHSKMTEEISELIEPMRGVGGPYEPCADKLESLIEIVKEYQDNADRSGNREVETQHDMLYEQCQNAIVSGALPCTEDDYVYLGGLQLYVEDICEFGTDFPLRLSTIDSITPTRIKQSIYPSAASSKVMVRRIRAYYEYFCELMPTERNAKHNYIDCCQGLDGYGCRFFKLKQKVPSKGGKKHVCVPRQFGVSSKRIAVLDEKTKAPIEKWSFRDLRTWEPSEDNLSVRFHFKSALREFQFDNKSLLKELTNYILTCTMEINYQGLRNIDTNPWSRTCEEAGTWGAPAVRKYLQQLRSESEGSPNGTLNRGSPSGRERSRTCVPVTEKKPMSPFSRSQSYSAKLVSKSVPAKAGESASEALKSIRGGDGPETSGSSGSSGMTVDQVLKNSLYLESLVSGVSGEPSTASGRTRRSRGTSFATVKEVDTEVTCPGMTQIAELSEKLPMLPGGVDSLQNGILNYLPNKGSSSKIVACQCPPDADLPNLNRQDFSAFELLQHPKELARQITLIDHDLFRAMSSRDIQEKLSLGIIRKIIRPGESPHTVERVAHRFNQLSNWISFCIVSEKNIERRAQLFVNFIETAKQCLELRNYNAVMSIVVAALGSAPVRRLQATKELIQPEFLHLLSKLETLMDTKNNYKRYREALRTSPTPAVPYFGIYLKDLTFISDGNPDYFRGGLINVNKRRLVYVLLDEVHRFQRKRYNIQEVSEIRRYLLSRPQTSEDELHRMSHEIEPSVHQRVLDDAPGPVPIAVEKRASIASANIRHPPSNKIMTKRMLSVTKTCQGATIA